MKDHPILYTGEMVRAVLTCAKCGHISIPFPCERCGSTEFVKTHTRRVIKPQPGNYDGMARHDWLWYGWKEHSAMPFDDHIFSCPYGKPGDRLWVKENWMPTCDYRIRSGNWKTGSFGLVEYPADSAREWREITKPQYNYLLIKLHDKRKDGYLKTRVARFMPRFASRILLEVTDIRVERVQEIAVSPEDVLAEGITAVTEAAEHLAFEFKRLWDSLNDERGFGWDKNPWVWVVEFKRIGGSNGK